MANNVKKGRFLVSFISFLLGLLLGIIIVIGALAGAGIFVANTKIKDIPGNLKDDGTYVYINGDTATGGASTVLDLINKLGNMVKTMDDVTIGDVKGLLPVAQNIIDEFNEATGNYLTLQEGELEAVKVLEFKIWLSHLVDKINVVGIVQPKTNNTVIAYLCYKIRGLKSDGEGGYTAKYTDDNGVEHICNLTLDDNGVIVKVSYEDNGEEVTVPVVHINEFQNRVDGLMHDLTISEIIPDFPEDDKLMGSIKDSTINTLSADIQKLTIQQLFSDDIYAPGQATDGAAHMPAKEYLAVTDVPQEAESFDENFIYYIKNGESFELAGYNGKLKEEEYNAYIEGGTAVYTSGEGKIYYSPAYLYYTRDEDGNLKLIQGEDGAGRSEYREGIYTYGQPTPLWRILLYSTVASGVEYDREESYTLNDVNKMINNVTKNTRNTRMRDLHKAGILTFSKPEDLEVTLKWTEMVEGVPTEKQSKLGDMILGDLVSVVVLMARASSAVPSP